MKTLDKVFGTLFAVLCLVTTGATVCGYTHQWVMALVSGVMAVALLWEAFRKKAKTI